MASAYMKSKWLTESLPAEATVAVALAGGGRGEGASGLVCSLLDLDWDPW